LAPAGRKRRRPRERPAGYARAEARNAEIRARLRPLEPGERPLALRPAAAVGLWQRSYWAVLAFEALLGLTMIWAALSLLVASNAAAVLLCTAIIVVCAPLFWKLIRIMARLQGRPAPPTG